MMVELAFYPHDRVQSVSSLCRALGETETNLHRAIENIPALYVGPTKKPKKNGTGFRDVYDTKTPLKPLLRRINDVFFKQVAYSG